MATLLTSKQVSHKPAAAGAAVRTLRDRLSDALCVTDFGAKGDGVTNDSSAIQACITAAKAVGKGVYFPDGVYVISSLAAQSGRVFLNGSGGVTLRGTFTYQDNFPLSAATITPLTPTAPYFSAVGINFQSTSSDYGLRLLTAEQGGFISTFSITRCNFYGNKGLLARHMIGFQIANCEFNNVVAGARFESCTNGIVTGCRWQNQAESGVWITRASDQTLRWPGGENIKLIGCEFAVCTYGIVADQCAFLVVDSCLLDYCGVPLFLSGAAYSKTSNTYYGAANNAVALFSGVPGYLAPVTSGVAAYGRPGGSPLGSRTVGLTAHNCEFVNYVPGSSNPIVVLDGYINGTYPMSAERIGFTGCQIYASDAHSAGTLLYIKSAAIVTVVGNRFLSYNMSSTLVDAWRAESCESFIGHSNDFHQCRQSGVLVGSSYEKPVGGVYVQSGEPTVGVKPGDIWVQP